MKKNISPVILMLCFGLMLLLPEEVFQGASRGLLLWFHTILPTLFPFLLITGLLMGTGSIVWFSRLLGPLLRKLFCVSPAGSFAILAGFLCGYPMGAKVAADLTVQKQISREEGAYLLSFCNNTSPGFLFHVVVLKTLGDSQLLLPSLGILLLAPCIISLFTRNYYLKSGQRYFPSVSSTSQGRQGWSLELLDHCIMDSFEVLTKVGGYIMLFSVMISVLEMFVPHVPVIGICLPLLEITNGIQMLGKTSLPLLFQYPLLLSLSAFGGCCAIAQTQCMVQKAGFPIFPYILQKLATAVVTSLLSLIYLLYFT